MSNKLAVPRSQRILNLLARKGGWLCHWMPSAQMHGRANYQTCQRQVVYMTLYDPTTWDTDHFPLVHVNKCCKSENCFKDTGNRVFYHQFVWIKTTSPRPHLIASGGQRCWSSWPSAPWENPSSCCAKCQVITGVQKVPCCTLDPQLGKVKPPCLMILSCNFLDGKGKNPTAEFIQIMYITNMCSRCFVPPHLTHLKLTGPGIWWNSAPMWCPPSRS